VKVGEVLVGRQAGRQVVYEREQAHIFPHATLATMETSQLGLCVYKYKSPPARGLISYFPI
jgi:hypothetical protein